MKLLLIAIIPVFIVIVYIYKKDKYEKEPKKLLLYTFLFGGIASILISTILYFFFDIFFPLTNDHNVYQQFIKAFFVVALIEEFSKYIIVRYYAQPKKEFNEPFDGIVYAVMVSMGFAAVENIFYVLEGGLEIAFIRSFTAIPAHATFAILMGYFMGIAKFSKNKRLYNILGLLFAIIFHGAYDFFLFIDFIPGLYIGAFISLFIGILLARKAIKKHQEKSFFKE
jgi:RsiW-degrading membrane proteinase PrsW (M82 family)